MPRQARPQSSFVNDSHVLYTGWVLGSMVKAGLPFTPVYDSEGIVTNRVQVTTPDGVVITLLVPPPPDDWTFPL